MANTSSHCYLPRFAPAVDGHKRPVSMKTKPTPSQHAQLLTAWQEGRLGSVMQATWAMVLQYYIRSEHICFGYQHIDGDSVSSRHPMPRPATTNLDTFKMSIQEDDSIRTILDKAQAQSDEISQQRETGNGQEASEGGILPFNTILMLRTYRKANDMASSPISQQPILATALPDQCLVRLHVKVLRRDISIFLEWRNGDMSGEQMTSVAQAFEQILTLVLSAEDIAISKLNLFSENDMKRIRQWNSETPKLHDRTIHDAIHDQVLSGPSREAVSAWDGSLTFGELDSLATKLAYHLRMQGVGPEARVALCFDKSKWNIVAMLGVMKAGGAFVPLDPTHPTSRLQHLIESVKAEIVLCSPSRAESLRDAGDTIISLCADTLDELPEPAVDVDLASGVTSQNAAYVLFTSGSTGEPKGTLLEHRAFLSSAMAHGPRLHIYRETRALQFAAHTFDASLAESLTPLIHGACVCIPSEEQRLNDIVGFINEHRVDHACFTPSFIGFIEIETVPGLKSLVLAGEAMSQSQLATWSRIQLINGYGPTEASVASVLNSSVSPTTDCKDIGLPVGVRAWLVDPENHNQLVPVGCPGELLLEGPTLARCYVNNPEKTNDSFIYDPTWVNLDPAGGSHRRFYKTGDLVRYNSDTGALNYIGRKDTQVKVHGQRIELGEIENQLNKDNIVSHCCVLFPKTGFSKGRLAAVIACAGLSAERSETDLEPLRLLSVAEKARIIPGIRERLSTRLPTYMVPPIWLCVEAMPLLPSGKLDRKGIAGWVTNLEQDPDVVAASSVPEALRPQTHPTNEKEEALVAIFSRVLNLPQTHVNLDESFLSMGGDSIAAMTCIGMCKKNGLSLSVQDVLRSKSVREMASRARAIDHTAVYDEAVDVPFNLSPIQALHYGVREEGQGHFNQGIFTRLNKPLSAKELRQAIESLVSHHSMLRARFEDSGFGTASKQRITEDVKGSYRLRTTSVTTIEETKPFVAGSQTCINAFTGPLLAADYFVVGKDSPIHVLSMTAHHLVVDIVSWRIILEDLEDLLLNPGKDLSVNASLPFQNWCKMQEQHCHALVEEGKAATDPLPEIDFGYWGLTNKQTKYGDVDCASFEIDSQLSRKIMMECHDTLSTEPIDVFLAAMLHSFGRSFTDRPLPTIYNEGHGREVWDSSIDISHTVGWFTILQPVFVANHRSSGAIDTLVQVKDLRRRVSDNGRADFAIRALQLGDKGGSEHPHPFEMSFNYVGQHRDLQRTDGLFQLVDQMAGEAGRGSDAADFGKDTPRFGLFEISAMVVSGRIRFTFSFNRFMRHQDRIRDWVSNCRQELISLADQLTILPPRPTLSTYPMLSLTYDNLDKMLSQKLPAIGVSSADMIEDIYPCSRMQQGILLGQSRDTSFYAVHDTFEICGTGSTRPNVDRLIDAWGRVVAHHGMFRTIFVEGLTPREPLCQVVLKEYNLVPTMLFSTAENDVLETFDAQSPKDYRDKTPAYRFTICETPGQRLFCRIELSHAAMDGNSISILMRDLQLAYAGRLEESRRPLFKDYISYLRDAPHKPSLQYWRSYLSGARPCMFPSLTDGKKSTEKSLHSVPVNFEALSQLQKTCEQQGITLSNVFNAAWGLTLRLFSGSDDVCFSYMASLRDVPVDGVQWVIGPVINLMICRMKITPSSRLIDVLEQIQNDYVESLPYRHSSLIDIQHALALSDASLFNSGVSYRRLPNTRDVLSTDIECVEVGSIHDPAEFPVFVNIEATDTQAKIDLNYWTTHLSDVQATNVANTYVRCLEMIMTESNTSVSQLDCVSALNKAQIRKWNTKMSPKSVDQCAYEVIQKMARSQPNSLAVAGWDGDLTFSKLDQFSSRLASYLVTFGVGPGSLIPICFDKSVWNVVSMLAVMKAGGGCIPIDGTATVGLIEQWVLDHSVQVALASPEKSHILDEVIPYVVPVSESLLEYLNDEPLPLTAAYSDPAYAAFTSGTSCRARGVVLEHREIMTRAEAFASSLGLSDSSRTLQFAAHTSDLFLLEVFGTFSCGGCLCIPADIEQSNLAASISVLDATVVCMTPTIARLLNPRDISSLNTLAFVGEVSSQSLLQMWASDHIERHIFFGNTEASSASFHCRVSDETVEGCLGFVVSGVPWVVDPTNHNALVPIGAVGELAVEGPIVARRYLTGAQENESEFFENPAWASTFHNPQYRKFHKTGDLVRYNADGSLLFLGRKTASSKTSDFLDVSQFIEKFFDMKRISVVDRVAVGEESQPVAVAFISPLQSSVDSTSVALIAESTPDMKSMAMSLHSQLASHYPTNKVPSFYVHVSSIPLTPFGKLNHQVLRSQLQTLDGSHWQSFNIKNLAKNSSVDTPSTSHESWDSRIKFWKEYLDGLEPCNFPSLSHEAGSQETFTSTLKISAPKLHAFSKVPGLSVRIILQTAWAIVLRCYTGSDDVCFGISNDGDNISTSVCRYQLNDGLTLSQLFQTCQAELDKASENHASISELQNELGFNDIAFFNSHLAYHTTSAVSSDKITSSDLADACKIIVTAVVCEDTANVHFSFSCSIITPSQASYVVDTFDHILDEITCNWSEQQTLSNLDLLPERSIRQIRDWNSFQPPRVEKCADDLIKQQALLHPRAEAICSWDKNFTFGQLEIVAGRLGRYLTNLRVKPEVFVVLCFEKSAWAVVAQVAVLKAGGAFVSIDPTHPEARMKTLIDEIGADIVLCSPSLQPKLSKLCKKAFAVSQKSISQLPESPLALTPVRPSPHNAAYAIFTSGTTGKPKATVVEHIGLSTTAMAMMNALHMDSQTRALQFSNYTFDVSVMEILMVLMTGGCVCVPSEEERMNNLVGAVHRMNVNYLATPPAIMNTLDPKSVPKLKTIITGGEKMPSYHIDRWHDRFVVNAYGPSEAAVCATTGVKVDWEGNRVNDDPTSIGVAVNCRIWIVDPNNYNRLLPVGAVGEMLLEGSTISRGYLGNPEKTKAVFVEDPEWSRRDDLADLFKRKYRMYRTGDLARYNPDGSFSFISRKDTQIKFNGQRIELEEIEQQCVSCLPEGAQVAVDVVVPQERSVAKSLAAFFTVYDHDSFQGGSSNEFAPTIQGADPLLLPISISNMDTIQKLKSSLPDLLPQSIMPRLFFPLRNLPFTSSAKIDRRRLRAMVQTLPADILKSYVTFKTTSGDEVLCSNGVDVKLRELWERTLDLKPGSVSNDDSFFALGGDSFTAMNLVGAAQAEGISLTVATIFKNPVLGAMAQACSVTADMGSSGPLSVKPFSLVPSSANLESLLDEISDACGLQRDAIEDVYPCSAVQEGLLTMSIKQQGAYVAQPAFRLAQGADLARFKHAWEQTVDDLEILRTRILHTEAMKFTQVVVKHAPIDWIYASSFEELPHDCINLPKHEGAPLTGYAIVQPPQSSPCYFVWFVHHSLYDGSSIPLVYRRFEENYKMLQTKAPAASYNLFIDYLVHKDMDESDKFWKEYLAGISATPFPQTKNPMPDALRAGNTQHHTIEISRPSDSVEFTVPVLLRAAWALVLSTHSGTGDICFGETLSGRNIDLPGVGDIAGPVLSTVPTRILVNQDMPIAEFLNHINQSTSDMIPHLHSGLQRIRAINQDTSAACGFQNLLVIQSAHGQLDSNIWVDEEVKTSEDFFTHPLVIECGISKSHVNFTVHHDELVINGWQSKHLAEQFGHVLRQLISTPKTSSDKLKSIEMISPEEKQEVARWNQRDIPSVDRCVHDYIEEMSLQTPNAPAVCAWDQELTYKEFWEAASSFANYLVSRGVGPEVFVPVCLDKSAWAMVTLISILIAGGGYVPLDPHHPVSRHEEILKDVGATMILCTPSHSNRYRQIVKTVIPVSKDTLRAYGSLNTSNSIRRKVTHANMAYTLFTSGSTGRAKGIVVEHRNAVSSIMAFGPMTLMGPQSRVFQFASLTFDAAIMETLAVLMLGGCICVPNEDERLNDVAGAIRRLNVTWTFLTPSIASIIEPSSVPSLKILVVGGEKMSQEVITKWANLVHLMNGYGPTETVVFAVVDTAVASSRDPARIGYGIPCTLTWIVDAEDHNRLAPLGAVGELALEGPALAREYLKNPEKNAEAFIIDPAWVEDFPTSSASSRRIYKTGDLCYYNPDGSIEYISRKDHQIKLHGQRMELGEIEHRLSEHAAVRHAVVILPKVGPLKQRLVAVLSISASATDNKLISDKACELVEMGEMQNGGLDKLVNIQKTLESQLPVYMVPQTWALVKKLPMLVSGKLDRKKIAAWLESIDDDSYERIMQDFDNMKRGVVQNSGPTQEKEGPVKILREIVSQVLNMSLQKVNLERSFVSLGGDSITGMAVISKARRQGLVVTLNDILQSKSVKELAQAAQARTPASTRQQEKTGEGFELSPIQRLYTGSSNFFKGEARFNQSITVRIARRVEGEVLRRAINAVTSHHAMLHARIYKHEGNWQQKIVADVDDSYRFRVHSVNDTRAMIPKIADSQNCLDPFNGPIFAADLFNLETGGQVLFLVAHHMNIDMVSWRIILQDLEEFIVSGSLSDEKALSFQTWCALQADRAKTHDADLSLPFSTKSADLGYWGMAGVANQYGDLQMDSFTLNEETTRILLDDCHQAFGTDTVDILLTAIIRSFKRVFTDRDVPTIYNEGHGRESWDASIDLSRTVGWFTTMTPLVIAEKEGDLVDIVKRVKDTRRRIVDNGRPYFARSLLQCGQSSSEDFEVPMEILFNYLGKLQQLERADSLFRHHGETIVKSSDFGTAGDMGPETTRFALFELSAIVVKDCLNVSFAYSRKMSHKLSIQNWIRQCKQTLEVEVSILKNTPPEPTLSDYPLLPVDYSNLRTLSTLTFRKLSIRSKDEVEDIYPCSPMQEGLLLSQLRDPSAYMFHTIFEIKDARSGKVDHERLANSWQLLVDRHPVLRTVFIDSTYSGGSFDQLVLHDISDNVLRVECLDSQAEQKLKSISLRDLNAMRPAKLSHQFTVCRTSAGRVVVKIEINHAIIDGGGVDVLLRDLALAYDGRLPEGSGPKFSDYIQFIRSQSQQSALAHWKAYLTGVHPCHVKFATSLRQKRQLKGVLMEFSRYPELLKFCEQTSVTLANLTLSAWAIVLRDLTRSDDVCFGYLSAGRDAPVNGIQDMVGIFINMLCCRVNFSGHQTLSDISKKVNGDYIRSIPHQSCSLASIQHELGRQGQSLFNTTLSIQNHGVGTNSKEKGLTFHLQHAHDPSEYAVTVNVDISRGSEGIMLRYWNDLVSDDQAQCMVDSIAKVFDGFIDSPSATISSLRLEASMVEDHASDWAVSQSTLNEKSRMGTDIFDDAAIQKLVDSRVHEIIGQMVREGKLMVPHSQQQISAPVDDVEDETESSYKLDRMRGTADDSGVCSASSRSSEDGLGIHLERKLWTLWSTALGISPNVVRHQDSFFKLGGDSITAMKMVSAAREEGLILTVADVFNNPVFEDMLATVRAASATQRILDVDLKPVSKDVESFNDSKPTTLAPSPSSDSISVLRSIKTVDDLSVQNGICPKIGVFKGGIADVLPVTDFQAMSLTATLFKSRWMLNYFFLEGNGPLDLRRLRESCLKVVDAFDILRTVFVCFHDQFYQVVLRKIRPSIFVYETDRGMDEFTMSLQQRDREYGPREGEQYVQFYVVKKKSSDEHRIMIRLSHTQYDGVCLSKIMSAIKLGYEGSPLPPVTPFASYLRQLPGTIGPDHYNHWANLLKDSQMTQVVRRKGTTMFQNIGAFAEIRKNIEIPPLALGNITIATVMQAAWAITLAKLSAQSDVVFGLTISGRNATVPGIESTVGPCVNVIPVRVKFDEKWTGLELFRYLQNQQISNMPYESLGFREIIKQCTDWPAWTYFTTSVFHQNVDYEGSLELDNIKYRMGGAGVNDNFADLTLVSRPADDKSLSVTLGYSEKGPIVPAFASKVLDMVCEIVQSLIANPSTALPSPSMLRTLPPQVVDDLPWSTDEHFLSSHLKTRSIAELLVHSDVLSRSWSQVLPNRASNHPDGALAEDERLGQPSFQLDSSFFDLGGDIFNMAQVTWLLEQEGLKVCLEDLLEHPSFLGQMAVLALHNNKYKEQPSSALATGAIAADPVAINRVEKKKTWEKAVTIARKLARRSTVIPSNA